MASRPTPVARVFVYSLFLVVALVALWVPFYNRAEPAVFGIPFFYWFQLAWILVTAAATAIAYRLRL
jgi:Protein of unknown function (DUF3311)